MVRSRAPACPTARIRASGLLPPEHAREFLPPPPLPHLRRWCVRAPRRPRCTRARVCQAAACTHASLPPPPFFFFVPSPFLSGRAPLLVRACARSRRHRFPRARARLAAARPRAPPCLFFAPPPPTSSRTLPYLVRACALFLCSPHFFWLTGESHLACTFGCAHRPALERRTDAGSPAPIAPTAGCLVCIAPGGYHAKL